MTEYLITFNRARRARRVTAATPEMAYRLIASDVLPATRVAVYSPETGETTVYSRVLDRAGNITRIIKH